MSAEEVRYRRFDRIDRITHGMLFSSFLGCALTGLPLFFSHAAWAHKLAEFVSFRVAGSIHRASAILMMTAFALHLLRIGKKVLVEKRYGILWGPNSMVPQPRDAVEMWGHVKWFLGKGPRPKFDHFTYWEKFDYWAVFWGMGIIGGSGLLLWFPAFFGSVMPGWIFNIATIIHGEEALLAVLFIFTVHFFNGNLRPEKFPMDTVMFTGSVPEDELKAERPGEWERLQKEGALEALKVAPPPRRLVITAFVVGGFAMFLGIVMAFLVISSLVRGVH